MTEAKESSPNSFMEAAEPKDAWIHLEKKYQHRGLSAEYRQIIENILNSKNEIIKEIMKYQADTSSVESVGKFFDSLVLDEKFIEIIEEQVGLSAKEQKKLAFQAVKDTYSAYPQIQAAEDPLKLVIDNFRELQDNPQKLEQEGYDINISDLINKRINAIIVCQKMIDNYPQAKTEKYQKMIAKEKEKLAAILVGLERLAS